MELFLKKSKGSITVLVALILVPTVFFTGFLVDLARLKLYGNQAAMTADNYGEAVLSQYDNLLKELYGLFAVTQDTEALDKLDTLQGYIASSFHPSENTITWEHLQSVLGTTSYEGFMPYKSANVSLNYEFIEDANLRNDEIFCTQIGDFMKFRIAQQLAGDGEDLLKILSETQNMENNSKVIDKKLELDEEAEKLFDIAREYYLVLKNFTEYPDYIKGINTAYSACKSEFLSISGSSSYQTYFNYEKADKEAMTAAVEKRDRLEADKSEEKTDSDEASEGEEESEVNESESLSAEEQELVDIYDAYMDDEGARRDALGGRFDDGISRIKIAREEEPINFGNFDLKLDSLTDKAKEIEKKGEKIQALKEQLQNLLLKEDVSESLRTGVQQELDRMEDLFSQLHDYTGIADFIRDNDAGINDEYKQQVIDIIDRLEEIKESYLDCAEESLDWIEILDETKWSDFQYNADYKKLYDGLNQCFGEDGDATEGKRKKDEANKLLDDTKKELDEEDDSANGYIPRDIPAAFGYGKANSNGGFNLKKMVKEAVGYFSLNNFKETANKLVLKLYMVEYDFGMFSSRTTNINEDSEGKEVSLTGYAKAPDLNYLYQAELEYILGGSNSYKDNWRASRNKILAFRAVVNFTATYSVEEVNELIQGISDAAMAVNPILGLAVNGALRSAVAGVETAMDWKELKEGRGVVLLKTDLKQLTAYDQIKTLLPGLGKKMEDDSFKMDYNQYLLVMLIFLTSFDEVAQRTGNLIELNVNTAQKGVGISELSFRLEDAHTAVNAVCTIYLDFVVMPKGFAESVVPQETYSGIGELEKNNYQFKVTRGY